MSIRIPIKAVSLHLPKQVLVVWLRQQRARVASTALLVRYIPLYLQQQPHQHVQGQQRRRLFRILVSKPEICCRGFVREAHVVSARATMWHIKVVVFSWATLFRRMEVLW